MSRRKNAFLTPDVTEGDEETCRLFRLPLALVPYLTGALAPLTEPWKWEENGSMTPQEAAEHFAAILSSVEDTCPIMDVRQNPENPCILEKTFDGVTWEVFGTIDDCIGSGDDVDFRMDPEDEDQPQYSPDDGVTWVDIVGDPLADPVVPDLVATPGDDDDERMCLASRRAALVIAEFYSATYGAFTAGLLNTLGSINTFLQDVNNYLLRMIYPNAAAIYQAFGFGETDFEGEYTAATLSATDIDNLQCALYFNASVDAGIVTFDFAGVQTSVLDVVGLNPGVAIQTLLTYMQSEGLDAAANAPVTTDDTCGCAAIEPCPETGDTTYRYATVAGSGFDAGTFIGTWNTTATTACGPLGGILSGNTVTLDLGEDRCIWRYRLYGQYQGAGFGHHNQVGIQIGDYSATFTWGAGGTCRDLLVTMPSTVRSRYITFTGLHPSLYWVFRGIDVGVRPE